MSLDAQVIIVLLKSNDEKFLLVVKQEWFWFSVFDSICSFLGFVANVLYIVYDKQGMEKKIKNLIYFSFVRVNYIVAYYILNVLDRWNQQKLNKLWNMRIRCLWWHAHSRCLILVVNGFSLWPVSYQTYTDQCGGSLNFATP